MQLETELAIATMITGFDQFSTDVDTQLLAYSVAADGYRDDAIRSACRRFIRGEVKGHKAGRLPTTAEFSIECKSEQGVFDAKDWKAKHRALPAPDGSQHISNEERARVKEKFAIWRRAQAGDTAAQQIMDGWKQ